MAITFFFTKFKGFSPVLRFQLITSPLKAEKKIFQKHTLKYAKNEVDIFAFQIFVSQMVFYLL